MKGRGRHVLPATRRWLAAPLTRRCPGMIAAWALPVNGYPGGMRMWDCNPQPLEVLEITATVSGSGEAWEGRAYWPAWIDGMTEGQLADMIAQTMVRAARLLLGCWPLEGFVTDGGAYTLHGPAARSMLRRMREFSWDDPARVKWDALYTLRFTVGGEVCLGKATL